MTKQVRIKLLSLGVMVSLGACATVAPYERERLAKPDMDGEVDRELHAGEAHADDYREGARGGLGTSLGGCGCN